MKLRDLVDVRKGKKPKSVTTVPTPTDQRLIQIDDLRPGATFKYCSVEGDPVIANEGDILIAWDGANAGTSSCGLYGVVGSTLARLRPKDPNVITPFLGHFLKSKQQYLRSRCKGATVPHLDGLILGDLEISLPSIPEQRRISQVLDKAMELLDKRRAAMSVLDNMTQSLFLGMFGDPISNGWPMTTVADVAKDCSGAIRTGPFGSQLLHSEFTDEGIAVLGIDNVVENVFQWGHRRYISEAKFRQLSRYTVYPGDVLISIMGTCGRCAIVPHDIPRAINTKHLCCITLDFTKCLPEFLHAYFLRHPIARKYLEKKAKGAIMAGLNMATIKELPIPRVPIELQNEYAQRVTQLENIRVKQCRHELALRSAYLSLQHNAFRGTL